MTTHPEVKRSQVSTTQQNLDDFQRIVENLPNSVVWY